MSPKETYIPQFLDTPIRYLIFTPDEFMAVMIPLVICILVANFLVGLFVSACVFWLLRRFKRGNSISRAYLFVYWILPNEILRLKATPPSHIREFAG